MPLSQEILIEFLCSEYGWLPSQIKNESLDDILNCYSINILRKELSTKKLKQKNGKFK